MRRLISLSLCALIVLTVYGCAAPEEPTPTPQVTLTPTVTPTPTPEPTRKPGAPEFSQGAAVAAAFVKEEGAQLYAGYEAVNTGDCPAVITLATIVFSIDGEPYEQTEFEPVAGAYDVVQPGGKTFGALWLPIKEAPPEGELSVSIEFSASESEAQGLPLEVRNARVVQNYPEFSTVSGSIWNTTNAGCPLNVVYTAFYDESDALIGVFHFSKNADIPPGEFKNFVTHMQQLPIDGLEERTASVEAHAFGIE